MTQNKIIQDLTQFFITEQKLGFKYLSQTWTDQTRQDPNENFYKDNMNLMPTFSISSLIKKFKTKLIKNFVIPQPKKLFKAGMLDQPMHKACGSKH